MNINTAKKRTRRAGITVAAILISLIVSGPISIRANWGLEVGRANEGDNVQLLSDWLAMKMARNRIDSAMARPLGKARQRQLLGLPETGAENPAELMEGVYAWWMKDVMTPAQLIALNPAASCAQAQLAMQTLLGMMRQLQLLGMTSDESRNAELQQIFEATRGMTLQRCRDEALDECVATGRFMQIPQLALAEDRQAQLLGGVGDSESWADDALKQCAIYELHFVSTTKVGHGPLNIETVRDGKVPIKFDAPGGIMATMGERKELKEVLKGQTTGGNNPFFVSIKCAGPIPSMEVACSPGADSSPIKVGLNALDLKHRVFYVGANDISGVRVEGEDKFSFDFAGGIFSLQALIKAPYNSVSMPFPDWGNSFYMAHQKDRVGGGPGQGGGVKIENIQRGAYPVMFHFTYADQNTVGGAVTSDSTEFELIHKPKPKPFPARPPEPIRKPLKKPGSR